MASPACRRTLLLPDDASDPGTDLSRSKRLGDFRTGAVDSYPPWSVDVPLAYLVDLALYGWGTDGQGHLVFTGGQDRMGTLYDV